ncbi:hypothetical protein FGIG_11913 [Fasciola gigantica]|uniref:Uncharacterized protein n=1 Tax=Fasciola gigantica TaxID=46835 RepID=A0A504YB60_FASGI|nr:hypothetical protein FGIG_11913 [Fasciola gigantica]
MIYVCPSLFFSSEEVRCSLDELDAVIATFDEEARKHCQSLSRLRSDTPTLANSRVQRRGSLSLEGTFISGTADSLDYTSATLRNPRIKRLDLAPVQATENFPTRNDASPSFVEDDFPPPPPDAFAPENFILPPPSPPPPPPPLSPSLSPVLIRKQHGVPSTQLELITSINSSERNSQLLHSASAGHGDSLTTALVTKHSNGSRPISSAACRRPMVPQRAPSTRLSSVPITEGLRPRSVAADSTVPVKETPGSVASLPNSHLKVIRFFRSPTI